MSGIWPNIKDAHVASDASIAGSKVSPDFGAQNVATTGMVRGHGILKTLEIAVGTSATTDSTETLPAGAKVRNCQIILGTSYSVGGTLAVGQVGATTAFMATTDNNPQGTAGDIYEKVQRTAVDAAALVVRVTVGGAPAAGACTVVVFYDTPAT